MIMCICRAPFISLAVFAVGFFTLMGLFTWWLIGVAHVQNIKHAKEEALKLDREAEHIAKHLVRPLAHLQPPLTCIAGSMRLELKQVICLCQPAALCRACLSSHFVSPAAQGVCVTALHRQVPGAILAALGKISTGHLPAQRLFAMASGSSGPLQGGPKRL